MAQHLTHVGIIKRLKRAHGHLAKVVTMLEEKRPCVELAQQLFAVERAITQAKRTLIHDHIDHCLSDAKNHPESMNELKALTKVL